jgi:hypothetical protein
MLASFVSLQIKRQFRGSYVDFCRLRLSRLAYTCQMLSFSCTSTPMKLNPIIPSDSQDWTMRRCLGNDKELDKQDARNQ